MTKRSNLFLFLVLCSWNIGQSQIIDTLIGVGNHSLHFKIIKGNGIPILFESGNGDDGSVWESILTPIHEATGATLIIYDRAGLGKSGIDTLNVSFQKEIAALELSLKKLGYSEELFLVCHSFGGFYATLFANRNPKKIRGAVFIDVALPCFFTPAWSKDYVAAIADKDWQMIKQYRLGLYHVLQNLEAIAQYMDEVPLPENIPLTVVAAEKILPMVKEEEIEKWETCLKTFGALDNHSYVLAKGAGHKVWVDSPQLVIDEVIKRYKEIK